MTRDREQPPQDGVPAHGPGERREREPSADLRAAAEAAMRAFDLAPAEPGEGAGSSHSREMAQRLKTDPETVERDLIKLVLTIVELLRQLMERTALHRVDQGDLSEDQEERVGMTLMILGDRMAELCERYGLTMDDLNLDLGPLGSLLPRSDGPGFQGS